MEAVAITKARVCCLLEGREHVRATRGLVKKSLPVGVELMKIRRTVEAWDEDDDCMYFVVNVRGLVERCEAWGGEETAAMVVVDVSPELAEPKVLPSLSRLTRQIGLVQAALLQRGEELVPAEEFDVCLLGWLLGFPVSYHTTHALGRTCLCNQTLAVFSVLYQDPRKQPVFAFSVPVNLLPAAQAALEKFAQQCAVRGLAVGQQVVVADQVCL
ncbi:hypothetical protein BASA81_006538 [Batrachochytrium salamandrivorans]|nr:hypothetical protein BASA81_006538 [Batrachochytrium salamandrivorans]